MALPRRRALPGRRPSRGWPSAAPLLAAVFLAAADAPAADRTILAIFAHAGDAELTAGAVLARHKRL
ncbi:MAG TPA: hypothetical protein VGB87_21950, partial [Vicinamibacteria bacterium]